MGYYTDNTAAIYYSNGINATCHIATPEQVLGSVVAYDFPIHTATTLQFTNLCRLGSLESVNFPGFYIRHRNSYADLTGIGSELDRLDASWNIVPGLGNASCVSFESRNYPGKFLRHSGFRLILSSYEDSVLFKNDATFCERPGRSDPALSSFESLNYPGYFLRHQDYQLKLHNATDAGALVDSTFKVVPSFK
jgi:hypothetical protein